MRFLTSYGHDARGRGAMAQGEKPMKIRLSAAAFAVVTAFPCSSVALVSDETTAGTVVVTATRQAQRADEVLASVEVIEREEIERAGHSSIIELLSARQGIQVSTTGVGATSSVFIRGASAEHTLLLIDGMRVGSATSGAPKIEMIPLALIERIEILRGPASALYGADALGGVIQIFTRQGQAGVQPYVRIGAGSEKTRSASAGVSGSVGRLRYNVSGGHDRTDGFDAQPRRTGGSDADDDGFRNEYLSASLALGFRERDEIGVMGFHSDGRNWFDAGRTFDSYIDKRLTSASVYSRNQILSGWTSTVRAGHSEDRAHSRTTAARPSEFDTTQQQFTWQNDVALFGGSLLAAYEHLRQHIDTTGTFEETDREINSLLLGWGGKFDRHSVQFNTRRDRNSQFGHKTTGIAAYGYQLGSDWRVQGSVGTAFKAPSFNDLYFPVFCDPDWGCFGGNPDLKPEEALNREVGLVWEPAGWSASVTYFNNRVKNLIVWGSVPENVGVARLKGVEVGLTTTLLGFNMRAAYDYLDATDKDTGETLRRRAKHSGSLALDRRTGAWTYGVEWSGQGRRYDGMPNTSANRLSGYGVTNVFVHYALAPQWQVELRANNVFDKKYEHAQGFATPGASAFVALRYAPR